MTPTPPPDDKPPHRPQKPSRRYLYRRLGCWRDPSRGSGAMVAHHLKAQRHRRLRWHMRQVELLREDGSSALAIRHAMAGEAIARNLGDLEATLSCLLSRGRMLWGMTRHAESAEVMKAAIRLLKQRKVKPTLGMVESALSLCYRLSNTLAGQSQFGQAEQFSQAARTYLRRFAQMKGSREAVITHEAHINWIDGIRSLYQDDLELAFEHFELAAEGYEQVRNLQNNIRIRCERASLELERATRLLRRGGLASARDRLTTADTLLSEAEALLTGAPKVSLQLIPVIWRRRLEMLRGDARRSGVSQMLRVAVAARRLEDPFAVSYALAQAARELDALGQREAALAMFERAIAVLRAEDRALKVCLRREMGTLVASTPKPPTTAEE